MTKLMAIALTAVVALGALSLLPNVLQTPDTTTEQRDDSVKERTLPQIPDLLKADAPLKKTSVKRTLTLEAGNTVVLRGVVDAGSVGKLMKQIGEMSRRLPKDGTIYLVLDTPGGSVMDGADLIDFLEGIPQKITTVTLFAASMGFQIVENNPGERLIIRNGILMSHRAALDGLGGQFDGELESRYRMYKRKIDFLELADANRMGISLDQYKAKVKDELWVHGFDAVDQKVADAQVLVTCGASMKGTDELTINTFFGPVEVVFDKCPLMKQPIAVRLAQVRLDARQYVWSVVYDLFYNKEKFTKDIIIGNKFDKIFSNN